MRKSKNPNESGSFISDRVSSSPSNTVLIIGRASFTYGLTEIKFYPGLHARAAVNLEYSQADELVRAIEVGAMADAFVKKIPMMAFTGNQQIFFNVFVNWHFIGRRTGKR